MRIKKMRIKKLYIEGNQLYITTIEGKLETIKIPEEVLEELLIVYNDGEVSIVVNSNNIEFKCYDEKDVGCLLRFTDFEGIPILSILSPRMVKE